MTKSCPPPSTSEKRDEQARALCLRLLTARARTRVELARQLANRGFADDVSARVLDRLGSVGLVNDVEYAEQYVHSRCANARKSKRAVAAELRAKGVDDEVIGAALEGLTPAAERDQAAQLVQTRLRRENLDDQRKVARRLVGMLARRGYENSVACDVVKVQLALELERRRT